MWHTCSIPYSKCLIFKLVGWGGWVTPLMVRNFYMQNQYTWCMLYHKYANLKYLKLLVLLTALIVVRGLIKFFWKFQGLVFLFVRLFFSVIFFPVFVRSWRRGFRSWFSWSSQPWSLRSSWPFESLCSPRRSGNTTVANCCNV